MRKNQFFVSRGEQKERLRRTIVSEETRLQRELATEHGAGSVDWRIQFAEAFADNRGGFDIVLANPPYVRHERIRSIKPQLKALFADDYAGTADLYCYFFLRGLQLLRRGGMLAFLSSNKWLRAAYGRKLRSALAGRTRVFELIDFGDAPLFAAVAYPCIVVLQRVDAPPASSSEVLALKWKPGGSVAQFADAVKKESFPLQQGELRPDGWRLETPANRRFLDRLRAAGTPLREYVGRRVCRGITSGLNEAFVVDRATRDRLIAEDGSSAKLLRPFMRGRNVDRWAAMPADQFLITTASSRNVEHPWSGKPAAEAERIYARCYPAIYRFHRQFRQALIDRHDQGRYFWELRGCAYWRAFAGEKIISTKVSVRPTFALEGDGCYLGNTAYFFPVESVGRYLLSLLNSNVFGAYAKRVFAEKQNGWYEVQPAGLESFHVAAAQPEQQSCCERLVDYLLWLTAYYGAQQADKPARYVLMLDYFERLLNGLVYELYFVEDIHAHGVQLFELVGRAQLPVLSSISEAKRLARLHALFEAISSSNHPLCGALDTLQSLQTVRLIEGRA